MLFKAASFWGRLFYVLKAMCYERGAELREADWVSCFWVDGTFL